MTLEQYKVIASPTLFVQIPLVEIDKEKGEPPERVISLLKAMNGSSIPPEESYRSLIQLASLSKELITSRKSFQIPSDITEVYQAWELRLISLLFANELQLAQQEAKRLSTALDGIMKFNSPSSKHTNSSSGTALLFPSNTPLSLRLLLIRLRSVGPISTLLSDYYLQLWDFRAEYLETKDPFGLNVIRTLAFGISATLIAKREYYTNLTHSNSILKNLDVKESNFGQQVALLAMLVSLIIGDADLAINYHDKIKDHFTSLLPQLQTIMKLVNPVLISKGKDNEKISAEEVNDILEFKDLDSFIDLVRNKRITGRILCSLCALFELELRDQDGVDSFAPKDEQIGEGYRSIASCILQLWREKPNKLYCFE